MRKNGSMIRRSTHIVDGLLAIRSARAQAARERALGREIMTLPLVAARLAGGFAAPAASDTLYPAIQAALAAGGFADIAGIVALPGMPRAVLQALEGLWRADLDLSALSNEVSRFRDLRLIESRTRDHLPSTHLLPRDLRDAALGQIDQAPRLLGAVTVHGIVDVDPLWRPLLNRLAGVTELVWIVPEPIELPWFTGVVRRKSVTATCRISAEACADPKSEVVEALRWARKLLATGVVTACDVAIAATSTQDWDDHFLAYAESADLPVHFSHGVPALSIAEGQACAALAHILDNGLSQERIWRLIRLLPPRPFAKLLPDDWYAAIPRNAALRELDHWREALTLARPARADHDLAEQILLPLLELLAQGPAAAGEVGARLLSGPSLAIWEEALRSAPSHAIALSLQALRVPIGVIPPTASSGARLLTSQLAPGRSLGCWD